MQIFLHSLWGQLDCVHLLVFDLKSPSDTDCLISCGTKFHIFGPKWDRVSVPLAKFIVNFTYNHTVTQR